MVNLETLVSQNDLRRLYYHLVEQDSWILPASLGGNGAKEVV